MVYKDYEEIFGGKMKKVFGVQAEFNITADDDIIRGIGKGIAKGSVVISDIIKEVKPEIIKGIKEALTSKDNEKVNSDKEVIVEDKE